LSLDLQIKTNDAAGQIAQITSNLSALKKAIETFPNATKLTNSLSALKGFTGVDATAAQSIERLAISIDKLGNAKDVGRVASGLKSLGKVDVGAVAANIEKLVGSLSRLSSQTGFQQLTASLGRFSASAQIAVRSTQQLQAALNSIRTPSALNTATGNLNAFAGATNTASASTRSFGGSLGSVNGLLAAFGVTLGAVGVAQFASALSDTRKTMETFRATADTTLSSVGGSSRALEFLTSTARELHLPLEGLISTYTKFATSATMSGQSIGNVEKIYKNFSTVLRGVGGGAAEATRVFKALEQMFNKGSIKAEELVHQLGDVLPGAVDALATSLNVTKAELTEMMQAGAVGTENILKFSEEFGKRFSGVAAALGSSWSAALADLSTGWFQFKEAFGAEFFTAVTPAVQGLSAALVEFSQSEGLKTLAGVLGEVSAGIINIVTAAVQFASTDVGGIALALGGIGIAGGLAYKAIMVLVSAFGIAAPAMGLFSGAIASLASVIGGISFASAIAGITSFGGAVAAGLAAVNPLALSISVLAGGFLGLDAALGGPISQLFGFAPAADAAAQGVNSLATAFNAVTDPVLTFNDAITTADASAKGQAVSFQNLDKAGQQIGKRIVELQGQQDELSKEFNNGNISLEQYQDSMNALDAEIGGLKEKLSKIVQAQRDAAKAATDFASKLGSSGAAANSAALGYDSAAAAAWRYVEAARAAQSAGGQGGSVADSYAGGGTTNSGGYRSKKVSMGAFVDAPMLAVGTANTTSLGAPVSGMPAILHPNEAVVPLAGGGEIPVQMTGGGDNSGAYLMKIIEIEAQSKTELGRIWTAINAQTVIVKRLLETNSDHVLSLVRTNEALASSINDVLREVRSAASGASSGGGGYTGGGGGSYTGGGGTSTGGTGGSTSQMDYNTFFAQAQELSNALSQANDATDDFYNTAPWFAYGSSGAHGPRQYSQDDITKLNNLQSAAARRASAFNAFLRQNPDYAAQYYQNLADEALNAQTRRGFLQQAAMYRSRDYSSGTGHSSSFATGSPNAYRDITGGFQATLHPDEAVIPLPDGRSVPVNLPDSVMAQMSEMRRRSSNQGVIYGAQGDMPNSTQRGSNGGVTVVMNVTAQDAASFQRSQAQIVQELGMKLERVSGQLGINRQRTVPQQRSSF